MNLVTGTIRILESMDDGNVGDVKTRSSDRTVRLTRENVALLRRTAPEVASPDAFFFRDVRGGPIDGGALYNTFVEAERALGIAPIRDLYSTKDTYISVCLSGSETVNLSWLSEQTGVSESTIKKHYGRFMHHADRDARSSSARSSHREPRLRSPSRHANPRATAHLLHWRTGVPALLLVRLRYPAGRVRRVQFGPRLDLDAPRTVEFPEKMAEMDGSRTQGKSRKVAAFSSTK